MSDTNNIEELAKAHWDYTGKLVMFAADRLRGDAKLLEHLYVSAFIHGAKHQREITCQDSRAV